MMNKLLIFGINTTAKSIYRFVNSHDLFEVIGFVVDRKYKIANNIYGLPVYDIEDIDEIFDKSSDFIFIAIQWNRMNQDRKKVYERLKKEGFRLANIIAPNAIIHGEIVGDNCWISDFVVIDSNAQVNNNVFVKSKAYIGNDSVINHHSFVGANSFIAGDVTIGESTFIGISATIFDNVNIGKKCLVGACTIVKRNLPDYSIVKNLTVNEIIQSNSEVIEEKLVAEKNVR